MSSYFKHLRGAAKEILLLKNLRDSYLWSELYKHTKEFLWVVLCVVVRIIILFTFPLSIPLLAFAQMKSEEQRNKRMQEFKIKVMKRYGVDN